jgi:molybdenum cofactor biosynthesis enzyme MoaA
MDDSLYNRIIDECAKYGCSDVHLHNFGEPLLDKHIAQRVQYAKKKGLKRVTIFSNGSLLTACQANELMDAGLDEIKISFDGATEEEFERIRLGLKFDKVAANIKELAIAKLIMPPNRLQENHVRECGEHSPCCPMAKPLYVA